jgi:GT2 family glycosyltransferase
VRKAVITLESSQVTNRIGLNAILAPQLSASGDTNFMPGPHRRMLEAAAFTTLSHLPGAGQPTIDFLERLMGRLPAFVVELGQPDRVPAALSGFLSTLEAPKKRPQTEPTTLVSVVVPVHNGAHFLAEAIESIRAQNHPALDIIVIDDGSTDDLATSVQALPVDMRFLPQDKLGPAAARNRGIRNAIGDYIAFLDVDDLWPAGTIAAALAAFQANPELCVAIGRAELVMRDEEGDWLDVASRDPIFPNYISSALFHRRAFEQVGLFDEMLWFAEDVDWFARAEELGVPIARLDRISLRVRRHDGNMTRDRTPAELTPLRLVKNMLDRRRARAATEPNASR